MQRIGHGIVDMAAPDNTKLGADISPTGGRRKASGNGRARLLLSDPLLVDDSVDRQVTASER